MKIHGRLLKLSRTDRLTDIAIPYYVPQFDVRKNASKQKNKAKKCWCILFYSIYHFISIFIIIFIFI